MQINCTIVSFLVAAVVAVTVAAEAEADAVAFDASVLDRLPGMGAAPPVLGSNVDGGSIFTNYINARQDGQFFLRSKHLLQYETPASPAVREVYFLAWCGLLEFSDRGGVNQTTTTTITHFFFLNHSHISSRARLLNSVGYYMCLIKHPFVDQQDNPQWIEKW